MAVQGIYRHHNTLRQRIPQSRHDATYGVFFDADSDSDCDCDASRRKGRWDESKPDITGVVKFISAGNFMPSKRLKTEPEQRPTLGNAASSAAAAEKEAEEDPPTRLGQRIIEGARARLAAWELERTRRRRQESVTGAGAGKPLPAPGSLESNTTVATMMAMMGYKVGTGLGKNSQGIVTPLEGTSRPDNAGLGSIKEPKPFYAKENLPPTPPPASAKKEHDIRWSKKAIRRNDPILTKKDLLAVRAEQEQDELPTVVQKVIDMRGPQARVLTDLRGLNDEHDMEANDVPLPELQYNVRLLVDVAKTDILSFDGQLQREREKVASFMLEKDKLSKQEDMQKHQLYVMETIAGVLEQVRADDKAGVLTLEALLKTFQELKVHYEEEFKVCSLAWIACQFAHPLLIRIFQGWQPLCDPLFGMELMLACKDLLQGGHSYDFSEGDESMAPYAHLVNEVILPAVRISGTNSWDAMDPEPMLCFLESWEQLLPPIVRQSILEHVVMPKLSAAVNSWDPCREKVPIHLWVHPWLPALRQRMETLCHTIRYKVSNVLHAWQAQDTSVYAVLSPWKDVFDPASWEDLIVRYIIPKLKIALQEFQINPANQKLDQFNYVIVWASAIPVHHMVNMLEVGFFRKWHQVLHCWLSLPNADFNEVWKWYEGWKGLFPSELRANERVRMLLATGLNMMNKAAEGVKNMQPVARENVGYLRATEKRQFDMAQRASQYTSMNFKESIQAYAVGQGLLFMPRVGKFYNGIQVYEFGAVSICIDSVKRVIYAQPQDGNGSWSAVSLKQLMEMNQMA